MIAPHPSWLYFLVNHYLRTLHSPSIFLVHLFVSYTLTFLAFCSLIVCVARDPGPISLPKGVSDEDSEGTGRGDLGLQEALMATSDFDDELTPLKWCRRCWGPKPERTHHCNLCGRCVLKMGRLMDVLVRLSQVLICQTITVRGLEASVWCVQVTSNRVVPLNLLPGS